MMVGRCFGISPHQSLHVGQKITRVITQGIGIHTLPNLYKMWHIPAPLDGLMWRDVAFGDAVHYRARGRVHWENLIIILENVRTMKIDHLGIRM
jgi:hypothetical protein